MLMVFIVSQCVALQCHLWCSYWGEWPRAAPPRRDIISTAGCSRPVPPSPTTDSQLSHTDAPSELRAAERDWIAFSRLES